MTNAKEEFLAAVEDKAAVKCVEIVFGDIYDPEETMHINLKVNHSLEDITTFLNELDFEYDSGYGGQLLFGTIWYTDGTWSSRGEYDGSEWWKYHSCPEIPESLLS